MTQQQQHSALPRPRPQRQRRRRPERDRQRTARMRATTLALTWALALGAAHGSDDVFGSVSFCAGFNHTRCYSRVFIKTINQCVRLDSCNTKEANSIMWASLPGNEHADDEPEPDVTIAFYSDITCSKRIQQYKTSPTNAPSDWNAISENTDVMAIMISSDKLPPPTVSTTPVATCIQSATNTTKSEQWSATISLQQDATTRTIQVDASETCYNFDCGSNFKPKGWKVDGSIPPSSMLTSDSSAQLFFYANPNCVGNQRQFSVSDSRNGQFTKGWSTTASVMLQVVSSLPKHTVEAVCASNGHAANDDSIAASSSITLVTWLIPVVCGVLVLVGVGFWCYRRRRHSYKRERSDSDIATLEATTTQPPTAMDAVLLSLRIPATDVVLGDVLGTGANGIVYKATWVATVVVVKKLKSTNNAPPSHLIDEFLNEIRLAAQFHHPNIVQLLGVVWTRLTDVGAVFEYMAGGPLNNLLYNEGHARFLEWHSPRHIVGKRSLAEDIAQALICLHGCQPPVLHRDLKSMNVLLTKGLRAKVTDFGLSRSMSHQTTMTAEVGTLAWIAPEVLSGERYTEKADIYSFGVILSEIDTLRQPYVQHTTEKSSSGRLSRMSTAPSSSRSGGQSSSRSGANTGSSSMNNVHIALMVCSGQLRPDFSPLCPRVVRELADRCLEQDPTDRPSALEALTALQRLH